MTGTPVSIRIRGFVSSATASDRHAANEATSGRSCTVGSSCAIPCRGSNSMVTSTGPPSTLKRRTSSVAGKSRPASFGDHPFSEGQADTIELPVRLERCGVGSVSTRAGLTGVGGPDAVGACTCAADKAAEQRVAVEVRDAHPVDRRRRMRRGRRCACRR